MERRSRADLAANIIMYGGLLAVGLVSVALARAIDPDRSYLALAFALPLGVAVGLLSRWVRRR